MFTIKVLYVAKVCFAYFWSARDKKSAMSWVCTGPQWAEAFVVWERSPQLPEAGDWGSGAKAPSRRRHGSLGAEPPGLEYGVSFWQK